MREQEAQRAAERDALQQRYGAMQNELDGL
jgi:hypothetical protein